MSVSASKDHKWFITCGTDQTVAAWSAEDWPYQPQFGASFEVEKEKLIVKKIAVGSPAWEMGLIEGEEIEHLGAAPLGDPVEFLIRGYRLSLRLTEARRVQVN